MLLTQASCIDWLVSPDLAFYEIEYLNNSADTIHVSIFGHEIGQDAKKVKQLHHFPQKLLPNKIESGYIKLNWDMEPKWECIWYSYGIDTMYVALSKSDLEITDNDDYLPWEGNDVVALKKYTKGDFPISNDGLTITYP